MKNASVRRTEKVYYGPEYGPEGTKMKKSIEKSKCSKKFTSFQIYRESPICVALWGVLIDSSTHKIGKNFKKFTFLDNV